MLERGGIMNGGGEGENEPTDAPVGRYGQYPQGGAVTWVSPSLQSTWLKFLMSQQKGLNCNRFLSSILLGQITKPSLPLTPCQRTNKPSMMNF